MNTLETNPELCNHQPVYFGVLNINIEEKTIGSVDIWHCGACKKRFCEEKQLGVEDITDVIGMPKIMPDEKWAVVVCKLQKGKNKWKLVRIKESAQLKHECINDNIINIPVKNYIVDDDKHWSFLVDNNINQAVEI